MADPVSVYADTSVYGGVFDAEFAFYSRLFFDQVRQGRFRLVVSAQVVDELASAPLNVREHFESLAFLLESAPITPAAEALQQAYLDAGIVSERSAEDALHVAVATLASCSTLVSWNFRHIVHRDKAPRYNAVNTLRGLPIIGIYSPAEVVRYEEGGTP